MRRTIKLNNERKIINFRDKNIVLLIIVLSAIFLRIGGNIVKEKVFFHKPFLFFGDEYRRNLISPDEVWYDGATTAFMKGKGICSMDGNRIGYDNLPNWPIDIKKIDENYYAHKIIPPLYPLFLALCYYLGGINTLSYFIPQVILGSLTCLFIYLLAKEIFNQKVALLAGFAVAFYPDLIFWIYRVRSETLFIFLLALGFLLLIKGNSQGNIFLLFMSAIVFGLACLTRVTFIPFIPFLFLWQVLFFKKDKKRNFGISLLVVLLIILVLLPWCMRNFVVFGKFTPFTEEIGIIIYQPGENKILVSAVHCQIDKPPILKIIVFIKDNFKEYLISSLRRFITFWSPYIAPMRKLAKVYKGLTWLIIFPLAFWGIIVSRRSWKKSGLLIIFIFYYALLHAASYVDSGLVYRYPIQPFLCIFAAYGLWVIYRKVKYNENLANRTTF